jgi:hypothetical protein
LWGVTEPSIKYSFNFFNVSSKTYLLASHFWVNINLYLKAELFESNEQVKHPSPSTIPDNQLSSKVGITQVSKGVIVLRFFLISLSFKEDKKVKNLAFLVGNTILPLNSIQIKYKFLISCIINLCVFCLIDCLIILPNPRLSLM